MFFFVLLFTSILILAVVYDECAQDVVVFLGSTFMFALGHLLHTLAIWTTKSEHADQICSNNIYHIVDHALEFACDFQSRFDKIGT